jgi:hypothetical protein
MEIIMRKQETLNESFNKVRDITTLPIINVQRVFPINKEYAHVLVQHNETGRPFEEYNKAMLKSTDNRVFIVENSLIEVDEYSSKSIVGLNLVNKEYDPSNANGMKLVTANIFADDDNIIWQVVGEGEDKRLVQTSADNIEDILQARKSKMIATASISYSPVSNFDSGDYVWYFDTKRNECRGGFGVKVENQISVLDRKSSDYQQINENQILLAVDVTPDFGKSVTATLTNEAINRHLDYMRKLFGQTEYFAKLESMIRAKALSQPFSTMK